MTVRRRNAIVVGVDGSEPSRTALMWAAGEASIRRTTLELVESYMVPIGYAGPGAIIPPEVFDAAEMGVTTTLQEARDAVLAVHPELTVTVAGPMQTPFVALRNASHDALMLVVGSHGSGEVSESILGSVALKVASHLRTAVVVVRTDPHAGGKPVPVPADSPIVVGLDGSAESETALAFALEEASLRGVALVAVHSWDDGPLHGFVRSYPLAVDVTVIDDEEHRALAEQLTGWASRYPDVPVRQLVERGRPAATLLRMCTEIQPGLLVVGSRGRGGFAGLLLGSTSRDLIAHAPCPVAVVR